MLKRILKPGAIPTQNLPKQPSAGISGRTQRMIAKEARKRELQHENDTADDVAYNMEVYVEETQPTQQTTETITPDVTAAAIMTTVTAVQTVLEGKHLAQTYHINNLSDNMIHSLTGLSCRAKFDMVLVSLGDSRFHLNYYYNQRPTLCIEDQFLLTLLKLRHHPTNQLLACNFGINEKMTSNIFITWINFMYVQWKEIDWWPQQSVVRYFAPEGFKTEYPYTRVIIDGTECPIQKPRHPTAQRATFSTYKNRNTMKVVVGATPGGLVSFISTAYGGSASDRQIVERASLPSLVEPGDEIMADKGFNCSDLFIPHLTKLTIPSFFKKRTDSTLNHS